MDNFIEFLDSYKYKNNINYFDFVHILNASQVHYTQNQYSKLYKNDNKSDIDNWKFRYESNNIWDNYLNQSQQTNNQLWSMGESNQYSLWSGSWQTIHLPPPPPFPPLSEKSPSSIYKPSFPLYIPPNSQNLFAKSNITVKPIEKHKVEIEFSVETIQDLINLIDSHPIEPNITYNIDLQGLHNIRKELVELNTMVGIKSLKNSILNQLIYLIQEPILNDNVKGYKHTILCGPPGTGKTEIAKIIGQMYSKMGILKNETFKKVTRNDLIAGYLGQTAIKTKEVIEKCLGGCLFIDEAYSLGHSSQNDSFSKECIDTLCEALSDHKDDLMVIIAGYENELEECFFALNGGLKSRFIWKFKIDEYNANELCQIFNKKIAESGWKFEGNENLQSWFEQKKQEFKNYGRDIEQLLYYTKICHSRRIYGKSSDLAKKITMEDLNKGYQSFTENRSDKKPKIHYGLYV